jgi:AbiV family abortive infection protein
VDLGAVKAAPVPVLVGGTVAAARNAQDLLHDAEVLADAGRSARAHTLAALAIEEVGKAGSLATLAAMPENVRARAPVGRMLEWHQLKLVGGMLIAAVPFAEVPFAPPVLGAKLATIPVTELAEALDNARSSAEELDHIKQAGLYVDVDQGGQVRQPSELSAVRMDEQLSRARQAAASASPLLAPAAPPRIARPGPESVEYSRAVVSAFAQAGQSRTADAAAEVLLTAIAQLQG